MPRLHPRLNLSEQRNKEKDMLIQKGIDQINLRQKKQEVLNSTARLKANKDRFKYALNGSTSKPLCIAVFTLIFGFETEVFLTSSASFYLRKNV